MVKHIRGFFANPLAFSLLLFVFAIGCFYVAATDRFPPIIDAVVTGLGGSFVVAAAFAIIYEYSSREKVVDNAVRNAVGQSRASALGIRDIVLEVGEIDHKQMFRNSQTLRISSRYSAVVLHGHRSEVFRRLNSGQRTIEFLRMKSAEGVPHGRGPEGTPDSFFKTLAPNDPSLLEHIHLYEVDRLFSYNFVESDSGIWIKLYFNAGTPEAPPAFFVEKGSPLYRAYKSDIDCLFENAEKVDLSDEAN